LSDGIDIIFDVWGNRQGFVFTPTKNMDTEEWNEQSFLWPRDKPKIRKWIEQSEKDGLNIYWCPTIFKQEIRKKEYIAKVQCLWADLDEVDPRNLEKGLKPSLAYETSPKRYQCLWYLSKDYKPEEAEQYNKNITYYVEADHGGWDLTQVLRIPGLKNFKYKGGVKGRLLWNLDGLTYKLTDFVEVPEAEDSDYETEYDVDWDDDVELSDLVAKYKKVIKGKLFELIFSSQEEVDKSDRSSKLWELESRLFEAGVDTEDIIHIIYLSNWNKYRGRSDEKKRIIIEVMKVKAEYDDKQEHKGDRFKSPSGQSWMSYQSLMASRIPAAGWLIEGWWQNESHGMVAGEPKTYKSTFVADFAASVASGKPLYGKYPVHNTGPVIMIQEENSPFLMQDRFRKIANHKGLLSGKVKIQPKKDIEVTFPPDLPITFLNNKGFDFTEDESRELLEEHIQKVKPVLIVFDPLYLMLGGKDENSSKDLRPLLNWLIHLRYTYHTAIMVVHHWNKSGSSSRGGQRMLGSVTLHGWVESAVYSLVKNEEEHEVTIDREFRSFPKPKTLDIRYTMGNPGDDMYEPEIYDDGNSPSHKDMIFDLIKIANGITEKELMAATGLGRTALRSKLNVLEKKGLIYADKAVRPLLWKAVSATVEEEEDEEDDTNE
jgi:hypothetical protein